MWRALFDLLIVRAFGFLVLVPDYDRESIHTLGECMSLYDMDIV